MNWYKRAQALDIVNDSSSLEERQRIQELSQAIDKAYATKNFNNVEILEEELENLLDEIISRTEGVAAEGYDVEGAGQDIFEEASLEELLANLYHQYLNFDKGYGPFASIEDLVGNMKSNVVMFGGDPDVSDEVVLEAAKDAYERKMELKEKMRPEKAAFNLKKQKVAKLIDKDPSETETYIQCMICNRFATNPTGIPGNKDEYIWKSKEEMDTEELEQATQGEYAFKSDDFRSKVGITTGICPSCFPVYRAEIDEFAAKKRQSR
jgi:hypothetical protein